MSGHRIGGIILLIAVARLVLPFMLRWIARTGSSELMLVFSAAVALAAAIGTSLLGFSAEMGAFLAGFLLASTPFRHQLSGQFAPMRDILMAVFFTAVGLKVDPSLIVEHAGTVIVGCLALSAAKVGSLAVVGWALGLAPRSAWLTSIYLGNAGEFSLVVIGAAAKMGVISEEASALSITAVILSLVVSPLLVGPAHRWSDWFGRIPLAPWIGAAALRAEHHEHAKHHAGVVGGVVEGVVGAVEDVLAETPPAEGDVREDRGHVVIAGFGPVGRAIADRLEVAGVQVRACEGVSVLLVAHRPPTMRA